MRLADLLFTRRRHMPDVSMLPPRVLRRLKPASLELSAAERAVADRLGLSAPPRLLMVDEEEGVILTPKERRALDDPECDVAKGSSCSDS